MLILPTCVHKAYSSGSFQALQLVIIVLIPWIKHLPDVWLSTFWKHRFLRIIIDMILEFLFAC